MKFMCRKGHLHGTQWRATNCTRCKAQERKKAAGLEALMKINQARRAGVKS
jgi:hypothetical protein